MYLPDLLNSLGLFQRCAAWMKEPRYADQISLLLGRASSAVIGIQRIEELQRNCVREFELFDDQIDDQDDRIVFNSRSMVALQNEISPLLSALRIMQDMANQLVRTNTDTGLLPRSMSDTMKKLNRCGLPSGMQDLYASYWENGGSRIRDYRILDQHNYANLVDHVFLQLAPSRKVLLVFPDNPEVRTPRKLSYEKEICGISTLRIGFDQLHEFIESVAEFFRHEPTRLDVTIRMAQLGDLRPFRKRTIGFVFESPLTQKPDGGLQVNISGIRFGQIDDGRIEIQTMPLSERKLEELTRRVGGASNSKA